MRKPFKTSIYNVDCLTFPFASIELPKAGYADMEASGDGDESPTRETHAEAEPTLVPFDVHLAWDFAGCVQGDRAARSMVDMCIFRKTVWRIGVRTSATCMAQFFLPGSGRFSRQSTKQLFACLQCTSVRSKGSLENAPDSLNALLGLIADAVCTCSPIFLSGSLPIPDSDGHRFQAHQLGVSRSHCDQH